MKSIDLNGNWRIRRFEYTDEIKDNFETDLTSAEWIDATVPGDIHKDLLAAGLIEDPYYGDNFQKCQWVTENDWCYAKEFYIPEGFLKQNTFLRFNGVDTYAEIYLNGERIGSVENMFRRYEIDISRSAKVGNNLLLVYVRSVKNKSQQFPSKGYFGCFNINRIFIRKTQCHFSWDWAPDFPATGIWEDVELNTYDGTFIDSMAIRTAINGEVAFFFNLHKNTFLKDEHRTRTILLKVKIDNEWVSHRLDIKGIKNFLSIKIDDPELWWPAELG
ncbi:hypothetical protein EOM86_00875, partial [Candidatus Nomurabacteria bacterium]|nr:hypothetical protein [Candidatus Nomurabacteria bacterium]